MDIIAQLGLEDMRGKKPQHKHQQKEAVGLDTIQAE